MILQSGHVKVLQILQRQQPSKNGLRPRRSPIVDIVFYRLMEMVPMIDTGTVANRRLFKIDRLVNNRTVSVSTISIRPWDTQKPMHMDFASV